MALPLTVSIFYVQNKKNDDGVSRLEVAVARHSFSAFHVSSFRTHHFFALYSGRNIMPQARASKPSEISLIT